MVSLEECLSLRQLYSRACKLKIAFFIKRSKVRKVDHAFLPGGIRNEDLTIPRPPAMPSESAR